MACIICFFEDDFQEKLRNISQQRTLKFEDTISEYKTNFIFEFNNLEIVYLCEKHKICNNQTKKWAFDLHESLCKLSDIGSFFEEIKNVYLKWINGRIKESIDELSILVKNYKLLNQTYKFDNRFFFRGRFSKKYLDTDELLHIPFDKRYLISNQRYSISGQPLIYLGLSILDIFAELKLQNADFVDINFSSFLLKPNQTLKVLDFTSEFESLLKTIDNIANSGGNIKFDDPQFTYYDDTNRIFYKTILISICSFKRKKESESWSFCEEYVLPQLITEIIRNDEYEGILFTSTRINNSLAYSEEPFYVNRHKLNLALFTKYNPELKYDLDLISKFEVSKPIKLRDAYKIDFKEIEKLKNYIIQSENNNPKFNTLGSLAEFSGISTDISLKNLLVKEFSSDNYIQYSEHPTGQVHYYLLYHNLLTVRNYYLM